MVVLWLLLAFGGAAAAIDVTACGQNVPDGEVGDLVASLDCTGVAGRCIDRPDVVCAVDQDCSFAGAKTSIC